MVIGPVVKFIAAYLPGQVSQTSWCLVPPFCCNTPPPDVPWGRYSRDAKEPSLLGFGSVRVLTKIRVLFSFKFFTSAENLGSVFMFSVLSLVLHCVQKKTSHFFLA